MRKLISIFAVLLMWLPAAAQQLHPLSAQPSDVIWPTEGWEQGELSPQIAALIQPLTDKAMSGEKPGPMGETRAIVIVHGGKIVFETYRDGFTKDTKQISWSVAKSITSALVGRAVHLGLIKSIDDPMPTPHGEGNPRGEISWRHWLNMTEGLSNDELDRTVPFNENVTAQMMFGRGRFDVAQFHVDEITPLTEPGEVWKYSTPGYHMIGWALGRQMLEPFDLEMPHRECLTTGPPVSNEEWLREQEQLCLTIAGRIAYANYRLTKAVTSDRGIPVYRKHQINSFIIPQLHLIGMRSPQPEFDAAGTFLGGSNVWASAHDYAKFGYLYLRDGVWEGERLLPEGWVDFSRTKTTGTNSNTYGAGFWITSYGEEPTRAQAVRSPPWDAFNANGSEGQTIWIVPSRDLVIVRLGQMENNTENWNLLFEWCQEIARAFPEVGLGN